MNYKIKMGGKIIMCVKENREITSLFVNATWYGMNKAMENMTDEEIKKFNKAAGQGVIDYLNKKGLIKEGMTLDDVKHAVVDVLKIPREVKIEDKGDKLVVELRGSVVTDFLKEAYEENISTIFCPWIGVQAILYPEITKTKMECVDTKPTEEGNLILTFKKY
ncbi:MAG: hypothetical protein ACOY3U_01560 [Bacillota bacterium]